MWTAVTETLRVPRGLRIVLEGDGRPMSFADVIDAWRTRADFRTRFNDLLAASTFEAFRWETPAVTEATTWQPFECVLLDSPGLDREADSEAFATHFAHTRESVVSFTNLGGDALLVVPCPRGPNACYVHLATFVRQAPVDQRDALWQRVGEALAQRIGTRPVWLSTAGAGVAWLHVRLDDRPKYYSYERYKRRA